MNRRYAAIAVGALMFVVLAAVTFWRARPEETSAPEPSGENAQAIVVEEGETLVRLFFPSGSGWLVAEERAIEADGESLDARTVAAEVLAGPDGESLYAPFPAGTEAGTVFISKDGVAYVDLVSTEQNPPSSGSRDEMLSVFSLVNSLRANLPEIEGVVLLWNGQQRSTFAGHLDTGRPLRENRSLVRG